MRFVLIFTMAGLLLTACRTKDGELSHQIVGAWTKDMPINPVTFSWIDPVEVVCTFSSDGSYSERYGHRSVPVTFQGTWLIQGTELVMTVTNAHGTENYQVAPGQVGKVLHRKIVRVDEHRLIWTASGRTNLFSR